MAEFSKLRIGVLGAGGIAGHFVSASPAFKSVKVVAIGSREQAKAVAFATKHGLPKAYGSYGAIVEDPEIDAVYIALPNGLHKEWSLASARAGKHILCEKPMALTHEDARDMFAEADRHGVVLIEAFAYRFQPQTLEVLRRVRSGDIGPVVTATACFGFHLRDQNDFRLDTAQGAGGTWDVGVYAINLIRAVMGAAPASVLASGHVNNDGVDLTCSAILEYADDRRASIWSSFESAAFRRANIVGTDGAIDYVHNNHTIDEDAASFHLQRGGGKDTTVEKIYTQPGNGFVFEADAFADLAAGKSKPFNGTTREETLDNIATAEAILESVRTGRRAIVAR